ncbi:MAG: hypothetical protein ACRC92_20295 [Peptostreptococcaceae bacterium]
MKKPNRDFYKHLHNLTGRLLYRYHCLLTIEGSLFYVGEETLHKVKDAVNEYCFLTHLKMAKTKYKNVSLRDISVFWFSWGCVLSASSKTYEYVEDSQTRYENLCDALAASNRLIPEDAYLCNIGKCLSDTPITFEDMCPIEYRNVDNVSKQVTYNELDVEATMEFNS